VPQRNCGLHATSANDGCETEQDRARHRQCGREQDNPSVDRDLLETWQIGGRDGDDRAHQPRGEQKSGTCRRHRQQQAFD